MKRSPFSIVGLVGAVATLIACAGKVDDGGAGDAGGADSNADVDAIAAEASPPARDLGAACIPAAERAPRTGAAVLSDLTIDDAPPDCAAHEVCLSHYFQGRVTCPYGNGGVAGQTAKCFPIDGRPQLFTETDRADGALCCPGSVDPFTPIPAPVPAQCSGRTAHDAVYCSCRCDVPDDPAIDRSKLTLCGCGDGFVCKPLCDATHGGCGAVPKSKWGSYCVRAGAKGEGYDPASGESTCGAGLSP